METKEVGVTIPPIYFQLFIFVVMYYVNRMITIFLFERHSSSNGPFLLLCNLLDIIDFVRLTRHQKSRHFAVNVRIGLVTLLVDVELKI